MREIKFRAWDEKYKVMRYDFSLADFDKETIVHNQIVNEIFPMISKLWEVMQFIGLKDKNGKEIYEGDIVKAQDGIWEVQWGDTQYVLMNDTKEEGSVQFIDNEYHLGETQIIGNIHENPELLK